MYDYYNPKPPERPAKQIRRKPPVPYGSDIRAKAMAIREGIQMRLKVFGKAPTEEEARMLVLCNEIVDGEEIPDA